MGFEISKLLPPQRVIVPSISSYPILTVWSLTMSLIMQIVKMLSLHVPASIVYYYMELSTPTSELDLIGFLCYFRVKYVLFLFVPCGILGFLLYFNIPF